MSLEPPRPTPSEDDTLTDQERLDEAMKESFPASDPPSWNAGLSHEQAHAAGDARPAAFPWKGDWNRTRSRLRQKFVTLTDDDLIYQEGREDELLGRLQKKLEMTREEIASLLSECCGD